MVRITAGQSHTCGLTAAFTAYCWGDNTFGQLGDGTTTDRLTPTAVGGGLTFAYLKAGDLSTCGVTTTGVGYCWGDNEYGQLGNGGHTAALLPTKIAFQR
jgi:alpha-tubulin suppressor-like RCC1 family protein